MTSSETNKYFWTAWFWTMTLYKFAGLDNILSIHVKSFVFVFKFSRFISIE